MITVLDAMIKNHSRLASKFKRESKKSFDDEFLVPGDYLKYRYHHGFAEGLKMAKKIMEAENEEQKPNC